MATASAHEPAGGAGARTPCVALALAWALVGCAPEPAPATARATPTVTLAATPTATAAPSAPEHAAPEAPEGELETPSPVTFTVRPLGGPGTMGPLELSAASEPALEHVRAHLAAHPEVTKLRVECRVNGRRTSSMPDAGYALTLARHVTRWLVAHGVACARLRPVGSIVLDDSSPVERVRFAVGGPAAKGEITGDACER